MKKIIAIAAALVTFVTVANAQPRAVGVRVGWGGEISYQHSFGRNFGEFDLGWAVNGFSLSGTYDFLFPIENGFNFYVGPGATMAIWNPDHDNGHDYDGGFDIAIGGQIGMEYCFNSIPLQLSVDWRPMWYFMHAGGYWHGIALGIRYLF